MSFEVFCPAPFISQALWADGRISICCNEFGEYAEDIIKEFRSDRRLEMQNDFKKGKIPKNCERCIEKYKTSNYGLISIYQDLYGKTYSEFLNADKPRYLHFSGSNKCNLACKMCNNSSSDMFARTYNNLSIEKSFIGNDPSYYLKYLNDIINDLEHYTFHGGEPMRDENFTEIVKILSRKKETINVTLITNGTSVKTKDENIVDLFKDFKHFRIMMSLDSVKVINDYTRTFTDTDKVINNYNHYVENLPNAKMTIHSVISNLTLLYLDKFIDFLFSNSLKRIDQFSYFILDYPEIFKIETLPVHYKEKIESNLFNNEPLMNKVEDSKFKSVFDSLFTEIKSRLSVTESYHNKLWPLFLKQSREMDEKSLIATDKLTNILLNI